MSFHWRSGTRSHLKESSSTGKTEHFQARGPRIQMAYLLSFLLNGSSAAMQLITSSKTDSHSSLLPVNCCCSAILLSGWLSAMVSLKCVFGLDGWRDLLTETESRTREFTSNSRRFNHKLPQSPRVLQEQVQLSLCMRSLFEMRLEGLFWTNKTIIISLNIQDIVDLWPPLLHSCVEHTGGL